MEGLLQHSRPRRTARCTAWKQPPGRPPRGGRRNHSRSRRLHRQPDPHDRDAPGEILPSAHPRHPRQTARMARSRIEKKRAEQEARVEEALATTPRSNAPPPRDRAGNPPRRRKRRRTTNRRTRSPQHRSPSRASSTPGPSNPRPRSPPFRPRKRPVRPARLRTSTSRITSSRPSTCSTPRMPPRDRPPIPTSFWPRRTRSWRPCASSASKPAPATSPAARP